jgi:hypothetical protein
MKISTGVCIVTLVCLAAVASRVSRAKPLAAARSSEESEKRCNRECMAHALNSFFDAMMRHDAKLLRFSPSLKATVNGRPTKLTDGIWTRAQAVIFRLDAIDPEKEQAASEAVVKDDQGLQLLLVRIRVRDRQISEVEMMLPQKGGPLYAPEKLTGVPRMYLKKVPEPQRATRLQLIAAADDYFTALQTEGTPAYQPAPLAPEANRFENGLQTTNVPFDLFHKPAATAQQQMDEAWFKGWVVKDRRYPVLDEPHGIVLAIALMQVSPSQAVLLSEMFKVSDWKIRQVQAVLVGVPHDGPTGWN